MSGNRTILMTGVSGFLGSHIARHLIANDYDVIALKRTSSKLDRCKDFSDRITWINYEELHSNLENILFKRPETFLHVAWSGVKSNDRDEWREQAKNLGLLAELLQLSKDVSVRKIIAFGSQAEYGLFHDVVDEGHSIEPYSAYGCIKNCASQMIKCFAQANSMQWYWLRLFSIFGPGEENNWLIPSVIINLLNHKEMNLTACEQEYDYMFVKDLAKAVLVVIREEGDHSGVFNLSTGHPEKLKNIIQYLEKQLSPDHEVMRIGALPYRANQVMKMAGNPAKFQETFQCIPDHPVRNALLETIEYYKNGYNEGNE